MRFVFFLSILFACNSKVTVESVDESDTIIQADADADGYLSDEDCDDSDPLVNPGAAEVCDSIDNNCNEEVDEGVSSLFYLDIDGDGFGNSDEIVEACDAPEGYVPNGNDWDSKSVSAMDCMTILELGPITETTPNSSVTSFNLTSHSLGKFLLIQSASLIL